MDLLCPIRDIFSRNLYVGVLLFSGDRRYKNRVKFGRVINLGDQFDCPLFSEANMKELIGENVFIRTVTMYHTGKVVAVSDKFVTLSDAAWVADTGRFSDALKTGNLSEVEPVEGLVRVSLGAIVDVFEWKHELPRIQK